MTRSAIRNISSVDLLLLSNQLQSILNKSLYFDNGVTTTPKRRYRFRLSMFNPLTLGHFAKKCLLKRVKPVLGRCLAKKNPNCPNRCLQVEHWTSFCSCQIPAFKVRACAESKIACFLSSPLLLLFFPPPPFFSFVGHLLGFLLVGKDFAKRSRIVNFSEGSTSG